MVKINEKYAVDYDGNCYVLKKKRMNTKTNQMEWVSDNCYAGRFTDILEAAMRKEQNDIVANSDCSLSELLVKFKALNAEYTNILFACVNESLKK